VTDEPLQIVFEDADIEVGSAGGGVVQIKPSEKALDVEYP